MNDGIELPDDIPPAMQNIIKLAVETIYLRLADKQDISDAVERIYRLGVSHGRIQGAELMGQIINNTAEKLAAKAEA